MSVRRVLEDLGMNAGRRMRGLAGYLPEQAFQLGDIQAMAANDAAIEKKDRDVESVATL
jgi:hypothetical protein